MTLCHTFAVKVSDLVDEAYEELITGKVGAWKGAKAATFFRLLLEQHPIAVTWVANAMEERVYALMKATDMGLKWKPQFVEGMGGASRPDVVVHLDSGKFALIDITSDRFHILGKSGGWETSQDYVYLAEAWFPSVTVGDLPNIRAAIKKGGIGLDEAEHLRAEADEERHRKLRKLQKQRTKIRDDLNEAGSFKAYVDEHWEGDTTAASQYLQTWGIVVKGARRRKGRRKESVEAKRKRQQKAGAMRYQEKKRKRKEEEEASTAPETDLELEEEEEEEEEEVDVPITPPATKKRKVTI